MSRYRVHVSDVDENEGWSKLFVSKMLASLYGAKMMRQGYKCYMLHDIAEDISKESRRRLKRYANRKENQ